MSKQYKKRWGDRKDGRRLRTLDPYHSMTAYIMPTRNDACNQFEDAIDCTDIDKFLRKLRTEHGLTGIGFLHFMSAVYVRACAKYPEVNRFVSGQRVFARFHPELVMTVKLELKAEAPETSIKVPFEVTDTIQQVFAKINEQIAATKTGATKTDDTASTLMKLPRLLLKFVVWFLKLLDYFGKLPWSIIEASPFHGSVIITDMGSVGLPMLYHHIYNFGNLPLFLSIGAKQKRLVMEPDGSVTEHKFIKLSLVQDERTTDGFYWSQCYRYMKYLLKNPEELLAPPAEVNDDID